MTGRQRLAQLAGTCTSMPLVACLVLAALPGCSETLPLAPVAGQVTLDGQPLPRGTVQFVPQQPVVPGPPAVGTINETGRYELTTAGSRGALAGMHRVCVIARQAPRDANDANPPSLVPERYNRTETSAITVEVKSGTANEIDIALHSTELKAP